MRVRAPQEVRRELAKEHDAELAMVKASLGEWLRTAGEIMGELAAIRRDLASSLAEEQVEDRTCPRRACAWLCVYLPM